MASAQLMPCRNRRTGRVPEDRSSSLSSGCSAEPEPMKQPPTRHVGGLPEETTQFDHSSSGAAWIHSCQPPRTDMTEPTGKPSENTVRSGARSVLNSKEVTIPRLPPPPPRNAQKRSGAET